MIFKQADSKQEQVNVLNELLKTSKSEKQKALIQKDLYLLNSGIESEQQNAYYLNFYLEKSKNLIVLHDIRIEHKGRTAQIDHMLISRVGITVIESKSFKGILTITNDGSLEVDYNGSVKSFPNPLEQSKRHADVLKSFLEDNITMSNRVQLLGGLNIENVVLIHPTTHIKNPSLPNNFFRADSYISKRIEEIDKMSILKVIKLITKMVNIDTAKEIAKIIYNAHKPVQFDYRQKYKISAIKEQINCHTESKSKTSEEVSTKEQLSAGDLCPFCGNYLVLRKGKDNSSFLGCETYPKCYFTRRIRKEIMD